MRHGRFGRMLLVLSFLVVAGLALAESPQQNSKPPAQAVEPDEKNKLEIEEERDRLVAERFRRVLETNPRRGTALDRLYGYHVERGTLDRLVEEYASRTKKDAKDGVAWMIVGLLESQRGRDAAAVAAFRQAEANLVENSMPSYYLGQSLILVGQPEQAATAFETAITRKPNRNDLLDIFQALGRVYQRSQQTEKALEVWNRLEKLYPDDARVQEQIATTLVEEGQFEQALPRLKKLADQAEDKYRQTALRMDAADLKVKLKKAPDAIADFEKLLGELNPENWLYRDVRRRVEEIFLRNDDLAGLAKYYETWLEKNKTDVDAIARLAKTLATQGRAPEARDWLSKGVAVAPNSRALRQALIDQYVFEQNFKAAVQQYEAMDKADPNNPDTLREWGRMLMRDAAKPEAERRAAATAVWRRLLEKKPNDPVVASQTADLLRTAGAVEDAIALYKKAIESAPNAAQYREYLGEYYHSLKRSEEALATWRPIAEGANRTSKNLVRLAEVFAGFGYRKEAAAAMADAIGLEKDDFGMLMTYAELLHQESNNDEALRQIAVASKLASNPEEAEQVLLSQIKIFQATEKLEAHIDELQAELNAGKDVTADRLLRLARYFEANRQTDKAAEMVVKAQAKDPKSIPALIAGARLFEAGGNLLVAAETNRKLAALDRRYRTEYLTAVTKLEQRLGRREQALQAARDLLAASPGNPDVYKFFADLCFQLGDQEEGLEALRRSVRANPSDPQGLITLANALGERVRQGEAIELLWRALDKTPELDAKLGVVERITQLYLQNNQFDRLLERLERDRREAEKAREATLCIAQAYTTAGDLGAARQQLERLLTENTRDTHLLGQLSTLCEQEGDLPAALKYQRQLNAAAPSNYDHQLRLAQLLTRAGDPDEAADIWVKLVSKDTEQHRNLAAIDSLLTAGKHQAGLAIISRMLLQKPGNWELLYREGATLAALEKKDEAATRFQAILALKLIDDELSEITKHQIEQAKKKTNKPAQTAAASISMAMANRYDASAYPPLTRRTGNLYRLRQVLNMDSNGYQQGLQPLYVPGDFGEARMACHGWLYEIARSKGEGDAYVKKMRLAKDKAGAETRPLWDWYYFSMLRNEQKQTLPTTVELAKGNDPSGLLAYINAVGSRPSSNSSRNRGAGPGKDSTPPLPVDQLQLLQAAYRKLKQSKPDWAPAAAESVMTELKRAGKTDEEKALYQEMLKDANVIAKVQTAMQVAVARGDLAGWSELFNRLERLQPPAKTTAMLAQLPTRQVSWAVMSLMGKLVEEKRLDDARKAADLYLTVARRQNLTAVHSASSSRRQQTGGFSTNTYTKSNNSNRYIQLTYPSPNEYYDSGSLGVLYNLYDLHREADVLSDLLVNFEKKRDAARGAERIYLQLALGYFHWWGQEKDEAIAELNQAVQAAPNDHNLLLEVVSLRELNSEFDAAMTLLDSFTPMDMQMMQRREETALRLAERTGDLARARKAADRLFGLRLDTDKQLDLAGKMHRLGMHDLAETVLGRAQRQAGSKVMTLVRLMTQYQSQNQIDLAVQLARQILRKGPSIQTFNRGRDENDSARAQAINVLARSGQLKEMIERAEAQLKASPQSVQIHQALISYYQAAGEKKKIKEALVKMAALKPKDGKARYQAAEQLQQMGERDAAIEEYKVALRLEPGLFSNNYWQIQNVFTQANKFEELVKIFDEVDLRKMGNYWSISEPISALLQEDSGKELGMKLFRKAWAAFPQYRGYLMGRLYNDEIWRMPEIYTFVKEAVIPREDSEGDPWQVATEITSYGQEGRVDAVITRMMSIARKQQRLPELRAEVAAALKTRPDWAAGKALLAVIDIQMGAKEQGRKQWSAVFDDPKAEIPPLARFILAQELEFYSGCEDIAVKALEGGIDEVLRDGNTQFSYSPGRRLYFWYNLVGRSEDAKKLMLRFAGDEQVNPGYSGGYWEYQRVQNGISVAQELVQGGDAVEAVRIYNRLLSDPNLLEQANQHYGGGEQFDAQVEQGLKAAVKALKPSALPAALSSLLVSREPATPHKAAIDLVLLVESRDMARASLNSLFASAIKSTAKAPEARRQAMKKLAEIAQKYPADHSVLTANVLAAFAEGDPAGIQVAVDRLVKLVDSTPLEKLPPSGKANARQRAAARLQVSIWLAARECLAKDREQFWPAGEKLAARAAEAAKRQQDVLLATALFREWGQLEVDRGFKAKGEARWAELMEWTLPKQPVTKTAAAPSALPAVPPPVAPVQTQQAPLSWRAAAVRLLVLSHVQVQVLTASPATGRVQPATRTNELAPTEEQFKRAYEIALLAADKQMTALSLRTMLQAVRGGPPVVVNQVRNSGGGYRSIMISGRQYYTQGGNEKRVGVDRALLTLIPKWRAQNVPLNQIYDVLVCAALPQSRPAEVFLYAPAQSYSNLYTVSAGRLVPATDMPDENVVDRGLGNALVQVAIDAGKVDDLRTRLEARTTQPLGELPAKILLTMLALKAKDEPRIAAAFASLGERLKKDTLQGTVSTIAAVLTPALLDPIYAKQVAPLIDRAAQNYVVAGNVQAASELRFKLAEYYVQNGDEAAARAQIKLIEDADKKNVNQGYDVHMSLADEYLKLGWLDDAIRELGIHADNPVGQQNSGDMPMAQRPEPSFNLPNQFERFVTLLLKQPASRRYEILKSWSLPTSGRKSIRYYVGTAPTDTPPEVFAKRLPFPEHRWMSTMQLLADAAKECGKLDELSALAESMAKEKVENAELFRLFVQLTGGKGKEIEPAVKAYVQTAQQRLTKKQEMPLGSRNYYGEGYEQPKLFYPSEFLIMTLCSSNPALTTQGEELLASFIGTPPVGAADMPAFKKIHEELRAKQSGASSALAPSYPEHWRTSTGNASWITEAGMLTVLPGSQPSMLLYDAPLTGAFEVSVECRPSTLKAAGYGGISFHPGTNRVESLVTGDAIQLSQQELNEAGIEQPSYIYVDGRMQPTLPRQADFKKIVLQVSPEKIRCLTDGRVFYEDSNPAPTSPWLMLPGMPDAVFRNVSVTGKPTVPAEVKLTGGDYLEGWQTYTYGGTLPRRLIAAQKARGDSVPAGNRYNPRGDEEEQPLGSGEPVYDWLAKDGEIRGRKLDWPGEKASPSCLAYFRPLQTGDTLRYEFFYEPGKTHVHPSLGRVAFILEPDGLKLHWMTSQTDSWTGLKSDNAVSPPAGSPGGKLPLKAKEWNVLTVLLNKDSAILTLNDVPVFEWKLTSTDERLLGLFHYRDQTDVRVRNVVLKGAWSTSPTTPEKFSLAAKPGSPAEVKVRRAVLGEALFAAESAKMLERIRPLSAKERYDVLLEWVLPNAQRPSYQLAGHLQPRDVLGVVDKPKQPAGRRVILGGQLQLAPLELIAAAKEAGQLDQLCARLSKPASTPEDELDRRSRLALGAAALATKGDEKAAADNLRELSKFATQMKTDAPSQERWPDLIASYGTLDRPGLAEPLRPLVETINKNLEKSVVEKKIFDQRDWWLRACREIRARVELRSLPDGQRLVTGSDSPFTHWASVPVSANSLITGGIPRWTMRDGALVHFPGFGDDLLILDTPLRGDFEVTCELKLQGWEEVYVRYGSCQFELQADRKHYKLHSTIKGRAREALIAPPLPASKGNTYAFRLALKDGWFRAYVEGKEIASRRLGSNPEPWLMLSCAHLNTGMVKNLQITGSPTVPDRIDLLLDDELGLWNPYTPHGWVKRGEELYGVGKKVEPPEPGLPVPARRTPEAATFYQRPMLEDGAIEYEFFYDPEKAHVHPMLGRLTFLLEPAGVKLHWLTDGVADQSDTPVDNVKDEPGCRRGPSSLALKPKQWNKVRLAVAGDVVKVDLNGQEVYERPIESTNQRLFGLFHYSDRTEARVRNMTYVGAWPKKLPSSSELLEVKK